MGLIDRLRTSHRYAADAVRRAVTGSAAYSEKAPSLLVRMRMYLSVLRQGYAQNRQVGSTALILLPRNDPMAKRHNRMPVVLLQDAWRSWLDPGMSDPAPLSAMLMPCSAEPRITGPVSKAVSRVGNAAPARIGQAAA